MKSGPSAAYNFFVEEKHCSWLVKKNNNECTTLLSLDFLDRVEFGNNKKTMYVP